MPGCIFKQPKNIGDNEEEEEKKRIKLNNNILRLIKNTQPCEFRKLDIFLCIKERKSGI